MHPELATVRLIVHGWRCQAKHLVGAPLFLGPRVHAKQRLDLLEHEPADAGSGCQLEQVGQHALRHEQEQQPALHIKCEAGACYLKTWSLVSHIALSKTSANHRTSVHLI